MVSFCKQELISVEHLIKEESRHTKLSKPEPGLETETSGLVDTDSILTTKEALGYPRTISSTLRIHRIIYIDWLFISSIIR